MPIDNRMYKSFFKEKTIQRTDKFIVTFLEPNDFATLGQHIATSPSAQLAGESITNQFIALDKRSGPMPRIEPWHTVNVTVPSYEFQKEVVRDGPYPISFPVMQHDGFELTLTMEEDNNQTISKLIQWFQMRIMDSNGVYFNPRFNRIPAILVEIVNEFNVTTHIYKFNDCYFLRSTPITMDYATADSLKFSLTFNSDHMDYMVNTDTNF